MFGGCQTRVVTGIDANRDGSGVVRVGVGLDREALTQAGDLAQLRLADLRADGWKVTGPRRERQGVTWVRAERGFSTPAEANRVLARLGPRSGPFRGLALTRARSLLHTTTSFRGTVDLTARLAGFEDEVRRLGFDPGLDPVSLQRRLGIDLDRVVRFEVGARLPGRIQAAGASVTAGEARWAAPMGGVTEMRATATALNTATAVYGAVGLLAAAGAAALALYARAGREDVAPPS